MARHSTGCRNCVHRHVKCDEQRPSCRRCIQQNLRCSGPRPFVRHETQSSMARKIARVDTIEKVQTTTSSMSKVTPLSMTPNFWYHDAALGRFMQQFVAHPDIPNSKTFMPYIPKTFVQAPDQSGVHCATLALAYVTLANECRSHNIRVEAYNNHASAICYLREAVDDPSRRNDNSTLLTALLLGLFEMTTSETPRILGIHGRGLIGLLSTRGIEGLGSPIGHDLTRLCCVFFQVRALSLREYLSPSEISVMRSFARASHIGQIFESTIEVCEAVAHAELLQKKYCLSGSIDSSSAGASKAIMDHIDHLQRIEMRLDSQMQMPIIGEMPMSLKNGIIEYNGSTEPHYIGWMRTQRIIIQDEILKLIDKLGDSSNAERLAISTDITTKIEDNIDATCASIPHHIFSLHPSSKDEHSTLNIAAYNMTACLVLLWHLQMIVQTQRLKPFQAEIVQQTREYLSNRRGIRQATARL